MSEHATANTRSGVHSGSGTNSTDTTHATSVRVCGCGEARRTKISDALEPREASSTEADGRAEVHGSCNHERHRG